MFNLSKRICINLTHGRNLKKIVNESQRSNILVTYKENGTTASNGDKHIITTSKRRLLALRPKSKLVFHDWKKVEKLGIFSMTMGKFSVQLSSQQYQRLQVTFSQYLDRGSTGA